MKRLLIILSAIFSFAGIQAQTYLNDGDYVTISFIANNFRYYLEASGDGILTQSYATDECLWKLGITQTGNYTLQDLTTGRYLFGQFTDPSSSRFVLAQEPTTFSFTDQGSVPNKYMYGHLYYSQYYQPWWTTISMYLDAEWLTNTPTFIGHSWTQYTLYIEKWEQKGAGKPTGHFSPSKIEFTYAESDAEAAAQARPVSFEIEATTESYYQCVPRPNEEPYLLRSTGNVDGGSVSIQNVYWESTGVNKSKSSMLDVDTYEKHQDSDRELLRIEHEAGTKNFRITPVGKSPMGLKQLMYKEQQNGQTVGVEQWVDYDDNVVVEYTYGNSEVQTAKMRVVRKAYHEEEVPSMVFSINPATYTFATGAEEKEFDVVATHQHGTVIYNVDGQVIKENYTTKENISFNNNTLELVLDFDDENTWKKDEEVQITATKNGDHKVKVSVKANGTGAKRSATLIGTLHPSQATGTHEPVPFTIQLHQRGMEGGIKFVHKMGEGNTEWGENTKNIVGSDEERREQLVHTSERTIYYESGQPEVELRLPESGYSGYMRWYDYETGGDPHYNYAHGNEYQSTSWVRSPRGFNGIVFSAINTPRNGEEATIQQEGYSHGLYSLNIADGGVLDEAEPYNPMPIIKGWTYNNAAEACHIIACDVSAYTDYKIWTHPTNSTRIDSIQEPTLSYRQLFHLRPASEMADTLAARNARGQYLEEYHYTAPAGKQILLSTEYRYRKYRSHLSELCYFYRDKDNTIQRITGDYVPTWKEDGQTIANPQYTAELDYLIVREDNYENTPTKTYTLTYPGIGYGGTDLLIAKFVVTFVDVEKYGPTNKTIITKQKIQNDYEIRSLIDFNSATEEQKVTMNDGTVHINQHLPWEQSTYGYVYPAGNLGNTDYKRGASQGAFPFYGEYSIVNEVKKDWARGEQLGGKDKGFAMYIDGTMEPGLVASIEANANICEGQTMYCSAWLCNPTPAGWSGEGNPIFRCNVEGLKDGIWTNIETYFVGELLKGSGWQQVVFPIKSDESYEKVRVSIYNFATTNQGNDFMVDDICLFVSQLPIAAYRGEMACASNADHETQGIAVLRIDYNKMDESSAGYIYYQIFNETYTETIEGNTIIGKAVALGENNTGYYHDYHDIDYDHVEEGYDHSYGSIAIPDAGYTPKASEIRPSVTKFIDELVESGKIHDKAYIKATNDSIEKYLLYVAHVIPNTTDADKRLKALYDMDDYSMRMANTPDELSVPACNMQTPLHTTQNTIFQLRNSDSADPLILQRALGGDSIVGNNDEKTNKFFTTSPMNCANNLYFLSMKVENSLALSGAGGNIQQITAPIYADWLVGEAWDDVYAEVKPTDEQKLAAYNTRLAAADEKFLEVYGFRRGEVTTAIMYDMRRVPTDNTENPNYYARSFEELNPNSFLERQNYEIVKSLYDKGLLQFYTPAVTFYLGAKDCVRYWAFPIEGSAKTTVQVGNEEVEYTIKDCNEARFVAVSSMPSEYYCNIAPIKNSAKTALQKNMLPTIKMLEGSLSISFPINEIGTTTKIKGATINENQCTLSIDNDAIAFIDQQTGEVLNGETDLETGKEYMLRLTLLEENEWEYPGNTESYCRVGYIFFNLQVVPQTLVWQPTGNSFNGWGKNENWKGWKDTNSNNQIDEGELVEGFVPMLEANVIIPKLDNALLYPFIVPEHEHSHYPMTVDFQPHHCNNIYFAPEAKIHNQHLLQYKKAYVDMQITAGKWNMVSAPLKKMVSGDMFVPHNGSYNNGNIVAEPNPFEVKAFEGEDYQGMRHANAAYAFWQQFYNQSVEYQYEDGNKTTTSIDFVQTNSMAQPLTPGTGYSLYGLGLESKEKLTIRLPKPDTEYFYYTSTGEKSNQSITVDRGTDNEAYQLAFTAEHDAEHEEQKMEITLQNNTPSYNFLFGNPTMAYIDMKLFLEDNASVLNHVFHRIESNVWTASTELTMVEDRYLPPMTSVLLETTGKTAQAPSSITVTLSADHLTLNNMVNTIAEEPENDTQRLIASAPSSHTSEMLTIYAFTPKATARTVLATNPVANDYFVQGEDALFVSSGIENSTSVKSPLNMYTVAEQVPMMADVRLGISQIPLAILADSKVRAEKMQLAFYYTSNWSRTCYLVDSYTGQKTRIMNGLIISVEMPLNHEQRYYIEGPDEYTSSSNGGVTTSTSGVTQPESVYRVWAYAQDGTVIINASDLIKSAALYDITGRLITSAPNSLLTNTHTLPAASTAGVYVVDVTFRDNTTAQCKVVIGN